MKKKPAKKMHADTYKVRRIKHAIDLEWNGSINAKELIDTVTDILGVNNKVIEIDEEKSYRCIDCQEGYVLQYKCLQDDEWSDVTDLTEMKVWEYNQLVDELQKHYPDYPIEYLEGRFV